MGNTQATFEQLQMAFNGFNERLIVLVEDNDAETVN
jgi:hypothetical protein